MKSIDGFEKRLVALGAGMTHGGPSQETREFLARFTIDEIIQISDILTNIENRGGDIANDDEYTEEEKLFLMELLDRPIIPLPSIDPANPTCRVCGGQPVLSERTDFCRPCWLGGGHIDGDEF